MKNIVLLVLLLVSIDSHSQYAHDKKLHFIAGGLISGVTYAVLRSHPNSTLKERLIIPVAAAAFAGIAKELADSSLDDNRFDPADLGYTILGGTTITFMFSLSELKIRRRWKRQSHYYY